MKPKKQPKILQEDLFRMRLENMLDLNHELIKLSKHIDWESLDKEWGALFVSTKGAPAYSIRVPFSPFLTCALTDCACLYVSQRGSLRPYIER